MSNTQTQQSFYDFLNEHKVLLTCTLTSVVGIIALKRYMGGGVCTSKARLDNKTVLITGANTGLGKETAVDLAGRGARVLLACRDLSKTEKALEDIKSRSGSQNVEMYKLDLASFKSVRECARVLLACRDLSKTEKALEDIKSRSGSQNVEMYKLDLASFKSVRECAAEVIKKESRLDILINNAGVMQTPGDWRTEDGYEMQFGTNHLGHFLFTQLLLDLIKKSTPARIINVSSLAHYWGKINFDDINMEKNYDAWSAYCQSKIANVLYTRELSKRLEGTGVTANSLHPGVIPTELARHRTYPLWKKILYFPIRPIILKNVWQGSQTTIHCAVAEELEGVSGKYFSDCAVKTEATLAQDDNVAAKLWTFSEEAVGLKNK